MNPSRRNRTTTGARRLRGAAALLLAAWLPLAQGQDAPGTDAAEASEVTEGRSMRLADLMQIQEPVASDEVLALVGRGFAGTSGASQYAGGKELRFVPQRSVALAAVRKNLNIQIASAESDRVRAAIAEAEAVFNPVFRVSLGWNRDETHNRSRDGTIFVRTFLPLFAGTLTPVPGSLVIPTDPSVSGPQVDLLTFIQEFGGVRRKQVFASKSNPDVGPSKDTLNYDIEVEQQLPWGVQMRVAAFTTDRNVYYNSRGDSYDRDFATNMVFDLLLPLPGTRGFGPNAPFDAQVRLRRTEAERADWDVRTVINSTLAEADARYWELVRALENLRVVLENRKLVEQQAAYTQRLFDQGATTAYGKAQIDAELARVEVLEESARANVIAQSNALARVIEESGDVTDRTLYLPDDYAEGLQSLLVVDGAGAVAEGLRSRPEVQAERLTKEAREIDLAFRKNELRPDVKVTANIRSGQDASTIGYKTYLDSMEAIADPDNLQQSYNMNYNYPLYNRALKAQYARSESLSEDQSAVLRVLDNDITRQVNDALADLFGARARIELAETNLDYSRNAYDSLVKRRDQGGDVREIELVAKSQELLSAESALVAALVDNKVAETRLLASQGVIAGRYAEVTARTDFERHRVQLLSTQAELRYFAPLQTEAGTEAPVARTE